jgi:chaperone modulatory protein CbpM
MTQQKPDPLAGTLFDESTEITLSQLCEVCAAERALIDDLIAEGILEPVAQRADEPCFAYTSVRITRTVVRLQDDLGVNLAGAALALDLLERIEALERELQRR